MSALNGSQTLPVKGISIVMAFSGSFSGKKRMMMGNNRTILFVPCLYSEWVFLRPCVYTQAFVVVLIIKQNSQL